MKRIFTTLFALVLAHTAGAQITITLSDLPDIGNTLWQVNDSSSAPALTGSLTGGAGQTWNFASGWQPGDTTDITFAAKSSLPSNLTTGFPNSTMAYNRVQDSVAMYFIRNSNGIYLDGNYMYGTMTVSGVQVSNVGTYFDIPELLVPVPITYNHNQTYNSYSRTIINANVPPVGPVTLNQYEGKVKQMECIGHGTLITPAGTYSNTLMVRNTITNYDTTYTSNTLLAPSVNDTSVSYSVEYMWLTNDPNQLILLQLTADSAGTTIESASYSYKAATAVSPEYQALNSVTFYPVPTSGLVSVSIPAPLQSCGVKILTLEGKELTQFTQTLTGNGTLDLSSLANGAYLLEISSGAYVRTGKIVKAN